MLKGAVAEDGALIPTFLSHDNLKSQSSLIYQFWEPLHHHKEWKCLMFKINMYFANALSEILYQELSSQLAH